MASSKNNNSSNNTTNSRSNNETDLFSSVLPSPAPAPSSSSSAAAALYRSRDQVRSCIELSSYQRENNSNNNSTSSNGPSYPPFFLPIGPRYSNPFLDFDGNFIFPENDDSEDATTPTSNSFNDTSESSCGTLSEIFDVFDSLEVCLNNSMEALTSPHSPQPCSSNSLNKAVAKANMHLDQDLLLPDPNLFELLKTPIADVQSDCGDDFFLNSPEVQMSSPVVKEETQKAVAKILQEYDYRTRIYELENALKRFSEQATKVRILLRDKISEFEQRVLDAENRAEAAENQVRLLMMEKNQQLTGGEAANGTSWNQMNEPTESNRLCTLVREKERAISRLECQVEEQRLLRLQESRQVEEKAQKIKEWVSNKLRDLEDQNNHLREQNQKCETQLELLRSRLSQLNALQTSKSKDRHSTEDSSRGSYEGDRPSDESPPPDTAEIQVNQPRQLSATAACLAKIRRRSGAFTPGGECLEERRLRRISNLSTGSNSGTNISLSNNHQEGRSRNSRVDSGSVDMETPQSLSPRSPVEETSTGGGASSASGQSQSQILNQRESQGQGQMPVFSSPKSSSSIHLSDSNSSLNGGKTGNNESSVPLPIPVPSPVPVAVPTPICISQSPVPNEVMIESTQSLKSDRRVPIVPPRRCRTRSPTPNTSIGTSGGTSPHTETEEDASILRARLDAECQQLARDLQMAVRELVRQPELSNASRGHVIDDNHDYSEIYTPNSDEKSLPLELSKPPPPPPIHRFPSWEKRIYEIASAGLKVASKEDLPAAGLSTESRSYHSLGNNFSIPVYTTYKGRASQIRSAPFSGDSTDSSDEEMCSGSGSGPPHSHPLSGDSLSSPGKSAPSSIANSLSPLHRSSSSNKSIRREASFDSGGSSDYAIPPDAVLLSETNSLDLALSSGCTLTAHSNANLTPSLCQQPSSISAINSVESPSRRETLEKSGFLGKLGGKFKTWRKRWFVLKNGTLTYYKNQHESIRRVGREIVLDENLRINREDGAVTFEISTGNKTYYLTGDSSLIVDDWMKVLQNVVRRNATNLVLSMKDNKPTISGWAIRVKKGHAKRVWCVLIGKLFLTFKSPSEMVISSQISMRDARVEDVDHISDSDTDDKEESTNRYDDALTIGIFPNQQSPIYLNFLTKQDKDAWLYNLTIVCSKGPSAGTQFEQLVHKLMELDGDPNSPLWKNPLLLHSKESITSPLTTLSSEALQNEAIKLFKSIQLFMSVPLDHQSSSCAIDYHSNCVQNMLQLCLDYPELQAELICALVKQTSRLMTYKNSPHKRTLNKIKHSRHFLLNATQSLFLCDSSSSHGKIQQHSSSPNSSPSSSRKNHEKINKINSSNNSHQSHSSNSNSNSSQEAGTSHSASNSPIRSLRSNSKTSSPSSPSKISSFSSSKNSKGSSSSVPSSPHLSQNHRLYHNSFTVESKSNVRSFVFLQGWQLLSLAVSLFLPKNNKLLWFLKQHLHRNVDTKSDTGKYAAYCQRSIERTLSNGTRLFKSSRMEVLSILMKNPFAYRFPHSVPIHLLNGYQVIGFDGSTTTSELLQSLCVQIGCREPSHSGFYLYEDDPFEKDLEHSLKPDQKICDVISQWETVLREKGSGKFETRRVVRLSFKNRIYRRSSILQETDSERKLLCYQTNLAVVCGKFPLTRDLAVELAALMAQIDGGDYKIEKSRGSGGGSQKILDSIEKYYPVRYKDGLSQDEFKKLCESVVEKWTMLRGKSSLDCVRIYLTCTRKWPYFGATLFNVTVYGSQQVEDGSNVWVAIGEEGISLLDSQTLQEIVKFAYSLVQTFGGALDDHFMVVVDDACKKRRLLFGGISKHLVLEITRLVADYINACCCQNSIYHSHGTTNSSVTLLTRHNSLNKQLRYQPPATPRLERKHKDGIRQNQHLLQSCDSIDLKEHDISL